MIGTLKFDAEGKIIAVLAPLEAGNAGMPSPLITGDKLGNHTVTLDEDTPTAITLTGSDVDGDELTYTVIDGPAKGALSGTAPELTYTPALKETGADMGITVDPDVDRLALVCEDGSMFGEEYTLVAVADYVLTHTPGATVSNLSSTRALRDVTEVRGLLYTAAAVGEVNVVQAMKATNAVIGGEGNGGVIYPESHYGRDALVGIALFLSHLAHKKMTVSQLRDSYPKYTISKNKIELTPEIDVDAILHGMAEKYASEEVDTTDGVKIYIGKEWVHLRKSNTEPIIRIYSESENEVKANQLAEKIITEIREMI